MQNVFNEVASPPAADRKEVLRGFVPGGRGCFSAYGGSQCCASIGVLWFENVLRGFVLGGTRLLFRLWRIAMLSFGFVARVVSFEGGG